jgi:pimeloyl-ACP methyl ester carboxylesterase
VWSLAAALVVAVALAGILYQLIGSARSARRFPPPGQLVEVGGHRLHAVCLGEGAPAVVLESGIAASSLSWARVLPEVATFTRVCAYDRAGLAWSDPPRTPRTLPRVVDELYALLTSLGPVESCVMVGHSFGAFVCLAYAARYPVRVEGLVLVDPPSDWVEADRKQARLLRGAVLLSRLGGLLARLGVVRACLALLTGGRPAAPRYVSRLFGPTAARTLERLVGEVRKLPPAIHPVVQAHWSEPKCFQAMADHLSALPEAVRVTAQVALPQDIPLVVISGGDQTPAVLAAHAALAAKSSRGRHTIARHSRHWIQFDEPELVVEAIRELVEQARRRDPDPGRSGRRPAREGRR